MYSPILTDSLMCCCCCAFNNIPHTHTISVNFITMKHHFQTMSSWFDPASVVLLLQILPLVCVCLNLSLMWYRSAGLCSFESWAAEPLSSLRFCPSAVHQSEHIKRYFPDRRMFGAEQQRGEAVLVQRDRQTQTDQQPPPVRHTVPSSADPEPRWRKLQLWGGKPGG